MWWTGGAVVRLFCSLVRTKNIVARRGDNVPCDFYMRRSGRFSGCYSINNTFSINTGAHHSCSLVKAPHIASKAVIKFTTRSSCLKMFSLGPPQCPNISR